MRSAILKQSPCRTGRRKDGETDQTSAAVWSTPVPQRNTPDKQVSQAVRTVMGAEAILKSRVPDAVQNGKLSFTPDSNQSQIRRVNGTLRSKGWAKALADWTADVREGKCGDEQVALDAALLNQAGNSKASGTEYLDILSDYVTMMHNAGKGLQAGKLLQKLTPDGKLYMAEKAVQNLNGKLRSRKSPKARHAEDAALNDIIDVRDTALQTISDIFDALASDKERTDHGIPVEDWAKEMMRLSAEARPSRS